MADGVTNGSTNGNGHASPSARATVGFDDLPYFQDYLKDVLKPKIERTLEAVDKLLTEAAWRHIIATIAAEQGASSDMTAALLRPLLESKLGLKIEARLNVKFGDAAGAPVEAAAQPAALGQVDLESDSGMARAGGPGGPDILTVRRRPIANPLVNAVVSSAARPVGR